MNIREISSGLRSGSFSSTDLVISSLKAIADNDRSGRGLNCVAEISPYALFEAERADAELAAGKVRGPLHGIPVLLKDNIDVKGMHTTAGSLALQDLTAREDAFLVKKLREAGAVILGKANLSEFAYWMSRNGMPSGYSSRGGQVVHAYSPGTDPSGSSSGSAVAVSAGYCAYTIGTETDGSLMSPAAANAVVSIKPTVGLVSRSGILPLSPVQDTAGPMCTCVEDAAAVLTVIAGVDPDDPATLTAAPSDYSKSLDGDLSGLRIGILLTEDLSDIFRSALFSAENILRNAGAEIIELSPEKLMLNESSALTYEFRQAIDLYLINHNSSMRNLADIVAYNAAHPEKCLRYGQDLLETSLSTSGTLTEPEYIAARTSLQEESRTLLASLLANNNVDCLLGAGKGPVSNLSPISGAPCMSIPASEPDEADFSPNSYYLMADRYREDILFRTAYALEQGLSLNCRPSWVREYPASIDK